MKKNLVILTILVLVLTLTMSLTACGELSITLDEMHNLISYTTSSNEVNRKMSIQVKSGETLVYENINDAGSDKFDVGLDTISFGKLTGYGLVLQSDKVTNEKITYSEDRTEATYFSVIANPQETLGIDCENAKVTSIVKLEKKQDPKLISTTVEYDQSFNGTNFHTVIIVEMVY